MLATRFEHNVSENKVTVSEVAIESRLREIKDVLNHDLIPHIFRLNGWDTEVMPYFDHDPVQQKDIDALSSAIQRAGGVGMLPLTPESVNWVCEQLGIPVKFAKDMDREEFLSMLTKYESRSGDGAGTSGPGTSDGGGSGVDTSVSNTAN